MLLRCPCPLTLCLLLLMSTSPTLAAADPSFDLQTQQQLQRAIDAAFELELTPGPVLVAGRRGGIVFQKSYGRLRYDPDAPPMTDDTIFDLASLSKPIGCA